MCCLLLDKKCENEKRGQKQVTRSVTIAIPWKRHVQHTCNTRELRVALMYLQPVVGQL